MGLTGSFVVPIQSDADLVEFAGWTLRVRHSEDPSPRVLILVHGRTGDENSMWIFARNFPPDYWIVAPRAPYPARPGGFSWLQTAAGADHSHALSDYQASAESLIGVVDRYAGDKHLDADHLDLLGFSEGAGLAATLALSHPARIRRLGILAGFIPTGAEKLLVSLPLKGKPVFVAHGSRDELVPVDRARRSVQLLEGAGALVTFCEADVGHKVSSECLHALEAFFA
jgi:phospholipase/carboxylesterase